MQNEILRRERMPLSSALALNLSLVRHKPGFVGSLLAGVSLLVSAHAFAADSTPPGPAAPAAADASQPIEEVVVTARHRNEKAQDVPIPMTVLSGDDLNVDRIEAIGSKLPSSNITFNNPRQTAIAVRGIGNNPAAEGMFASTGVFVDGVYYGRPGMTDTGLTDLDQIELLRGPQGTQWGKNTTAGALNINTKKPSMTPGGNAEFSFGNMSYYEEKGDVTGAVSDNSAARLSVYNTDRFEGLLHSNWFGEENTIHRQGARAQWLGTVGDDLTLRFIADTHSENDQQGAAQLYKVANSQYWNYVNTLKSNGYAAASSTDPYSREVTYNTSQSKKVVQGGSSLQADYDLGKGYNLTSITAYRQWNFTPLNDGDATTATVIAASGGVENDKQYSQELRVSSPTGGFVDYTSGLYYFKQTVHSNQYSNWGNNLVATQDYYGTLVGGTWTPLAAATATKYLGKSTNNVADLDDNSYAIFSNANWHPTDRLTITTGLRDTYENSSIHDYRDLGNTPSVSATNPNYQDASYSRTDNNLGANLVFNYKVADDFSTFTSFSHGAKAGAMVNTVAAGSPLTRNNLVVAPEKANDAELGFKSQWLDRRLTFNADVFYELIQDYQATASIIDPTTGKSANVLQNVGWVATRGAEIDGNYKLSKSLTFGYAGAYDLAYYRSWRNGPCPGDYSGSATSCDLTGRPVAGAPRWNGDLSLTYQEEIAEDWIGYITGDVNYKSSFYGPWVQDDSYASKVKPTSITNIAIGTKILDGRLDTQLWVRNLFDRKYTAYTSAGYAASGKTLSYLGMPGDPLTIGLTTRLKF